MFHIFGSLVYNQNLFMKKNGKSNHYRDEWWNDIIHMGDKKGISAMTISDLTGIPRPTVIRKLKVLMNEKNVIKDKNNLYSFKDGPLMKKFNENIIIVCADIEDQIMGLQVKDRKDFMLESGIKSTGLDNLIKTGYNALGLSTFFTSGPEESRAWTIEKNSKAADAAGVIHSDFKKNFIRAETVTTEDFIKYKGFNEC